MKYSILMNNIEMFFGKFQALRGISINFAYGEIHTLLGENGAGKSTLVSFLQGINKPSKGKIKLLLENKETKIFSSTIKSSRKNKVYVIPQHFEVVSNASVLDNIIISSIKETKYFLNRKETAKKISQIMKLYDININLNVKVSSLTIGQKQLIEIVRMLFNQAQTIVLDEPTAVLNKKEIEVLFKIIFKLKKENKTIIFISHKIDEVLKVSDKISILRKGLLVKTHNNTKSLNPNKLINDMTKNTYKKEKLIDHEVSKIFNNQKVLELVEVNTKNKNPALSLKNMSFDVKKGEIVCIAAIDGNGEQEIFKAIIGTRKTQSGEIKLKKTSINDLSTEKRYQQGISYVPANRHHDGLLLNLSIFSNFTLHTYNDKSFYKFNLFFKYKKGKDISKTLVKQFNIHGAKNVSKPIKQLSGGNQQKVLVAREIFRNGDLLMFSQPTRGLDVNAISNIYHYLFNLKKEGKGILIYTSEIHEIVNIADKVVIVSRGKINKTLFKKQINQEQIMKGLVQ